MDIGIQMSKHFYNELPIGLIIESLRKDLWRFRRFKQIFVFNNKQQNMFASSDSKTYF